MADELETALRDSFASGEALTGGQGRRAIKSVQYWRVWENSPEHSRHNWIQLGVAFTTATAVEYVEFMQRKQATPLKQYGVFDGIKDIKLGIDRTEVFNNGTRFNPLIRNGGVHEMPKSQFLALGWHRNPELSAMAPDEYELDKFVDFLCPVDGKPFTEEYAMQKYTRAMYPEATSAGSIGKEVGKALDSAGNMEYGGTNLTAEDLIKIMGEMNKNNAEMVANAIVTALRPGDNETPETSEDE